jgi:hypothetical protein
MRTEAKYEAYAIRKNYFRIRLKLQDAGLSEALYRVGALAANDLRRQGLGHTTTDAGCPTSSDAVGEAPRAAVSAA